MGWERESWILLKEYLNKIKVGFISFKWDVGNKIKEEIEI